MRRLSIPTLLVLALAATLAAAALAAPAARADVVWLCKPGMADDPCEIPLDTTVREPGGGERVVTPARPPQAQRPVDCFYVYPTVSNQPTPNASKSRDPELVSIAKYQAARFSSQCRMFAPIYRQGTLAGLLSAQAQDQATIRRIAYGDVVEAWNEYLARDNGGRGVVLIGHSQGTRMLRALLRREIDPRPEVRRRLVGALLLGGNVTVARGRTAGGDFRNVPVCTRRGQAGCVVAFSSFSEDPPDNSRYGRLERDAGDPLGFPTGPGYEVACTDPGRLSGLTGPFGVTFPSEPFAPGLIAAGIVQVNNGPPPTAPTTWVTPADRFQGTCRTVNGANVLRYDPVGDSGRPNASPTEDWGTHLIDVNLGLERQVAIVALQAATWRRQAACADPERRLRVSVQPRAVRRRVATRFRFRVTRRVRGRTVPVAGARVRFAGRRSTTSAGGRATRVKALWRLGTHTVTASRTGLCTGRATVRARS